MALFTVNTLTDENDGIAIGSVSLRDAIAAANATPEPDAIDFAVAGSIQLEYGELLVASDVTIAGPGADELTIDGNGRSRVLNIDDGNSESFSTVSISGLTVTGGETSDDGAGIGNQETLTLDRSVLSGNTGTGFIERIYSGYPSYFGSRGGGLFNAGTATVASSTIAANESAFDGGGIANAGSLLLERSVVSGNTSFGVDNVYYYNVHPRSVE